MAMPSKRSEAGGVRTPIDWRWQLRRRSSLASTGASSTPDAPSAAAAPDATSATTDAASAALAASSGTLWGPVGTRAEPATSDRFMGAARFATAQLLRERQSKLFGGDGPFGLVTVSAAVHAASAYALLCAPSPGAAELGLFAAGYSMRMFGITGGYHRYFAHRSYSTSRGFQLVLALLGASAWQKGPLWWAAHHVEHHVHSDTPLDAHSPASGSLWWAHMGWFWASTENDRPPAKYEEGRSRVNKFDKYPELRLLDTWHEVPGFALLGACYALDGTAGALWGFALPTAAAWHATFAVNSAAHVWGSRRFETADNSRNNAWVALLTFGEGWHNNHHALPWSASQGLAWYEVDVSFATLRVLERLGIVWDLKVPSPQQIERAARIGRAKQKESA